MPCEFACTNDLLLLSLSDECLACACKNKCLKAGQFVCYVYLFVCRCRFSPRDFFNERHELFVKQSLQSVYTNRDFSRYPFVPLFIFLDCQINEKTVWDQSETVVRKDVGLFQDALKITYEMNYKKFIYTTTGYTNFKELTPELCFMVGKRSMTLDGKLLHLFKQRHYCLYNFYRSKL